MRTCISDLARAALAALLAACAPAPDAARTNADCAACHADHAARFATSSHARATESALFTALRARADGPTAAFCDRCHAPHEAPGERGVGCVTCHQAAGARGLSNGQIVRGDSAVVYGRGASTVRTIAHDSRASGYVTGGELCGTCHEVDGPGALVETPFTEWSQGPARALAVTCIDCHMGRTPGRADGFDTAPATATSPARRRSDHGFVGPDHADAPALLGQSAAMTLDAPVISAEGALVFALTIANRNPGHALPSGARFAREVWVEVTARDATGAVHTVSGGTDAQGAPLDAETRIELGDRIAYHDGVRVPWRASLLAVRALAPGSARTWPVTVPARWNGAPTVSATARLLYRRNDARLRASLGIPLTAHDGAPAVLATATRDAPLDR